MRKLKQELFLLTVLLLAVIVSLAISYTVLQQRLWDVLLNLQQSGLRMFLCQDLMAGVRALHIAAIKHDKTAFNRTVLWLRGTVQSFWLVHNQLFLGATELTEVEHFYQMPVAQIEM